MKYKKEVFVITDELNDLMLILFCLEEIGGCPQMIKIFRDYLDEKVKETLQQQSQNVG